MKAGQRVPARSDRSLPKKTEQSFERITKHMLCFAVKAMKFMQCSIMVTAWLFMHS